MVTNDATVGWYAAATRLVGTCLFLPAAITTALLPTLSRLHQESAAEFRQLARRMLGLVMLFGIPIALVLMLVPGEIISLLHYPGGFAHSVPVLRVGGLGVLLFYAAMVLGTAVMASDGQHKMMRASVIATAGQHSRLLCRSLSRRIYSGKTARPGRSSAMSWSKYTGRLLPADAARADIRQRKLLFLGRCAAAALPMAAFLALMSQSGMGFWIVIPCVAIYAVMCWLLRCISAQDIAMARQIWRGSEPDER